MSNQETVVNALERRIDLSVSLAEVEKDVEARLKKLARTAKLPGFRPGKVPLRMVAQNYGPQARSEAVGAAVERVLGEQVRALELRVAGYPSIEPKEASSAEVLEFTAVVEVYPEIVIADISAQEVERPQLEVTDAEVDKTLEVLLKQRVSYEAVERAAQADDKVVVDFTGRKDGVEFDGGKAADFPFVIGGGQMLKDFEDAAVGLAAGETKTFDMTFPADYHAANLAGQAVQFDITVKSVSAPKLPVVDAEFAQSLGIADGDVEKMRAEIKANLEREVKRRIKAQLKERAMNVLLDAHPIEVPKALVQQESEQLADNARKDFEARGMKTKDLPIETSWFTEQAVRRVKLGLIMSELVKAKELHAKPEQIRAVIEDFAASYEDPSEVLNWYYSQPQRLAQAEALVIEDNVVEWVVANTKTTDKTASFEELMGNAA
jgi:trigger factor